MRVRRRRDNDGSTPRMASPALTLAGERLAAKGIAGAAESRRSLSGNATVA